MAKPPATHLAGSLLRSGSSSRGLPANFSQQAARLVVSPQEDEAAQAYGCHAREDACK